MILSIIIPTLNEEKYLPRLLNSVKKQTFRDYEIIVADNKSIDKTISIARNYGCKIVKGGIPSKARNNGARAAKGEYLLFLDADTILLSRNFLKKALKEFDKENLVCACFQFSVKNQKLVYKLIFLWWDSWNIINQYFNPHASGQCILALKKYHNAIGGFDENIYFAEDSDYAYRISKKGKFGIISSVKALGSPRRFQEKGLLKTSVKMIGGEFMRTVFGEDRENRFKYFD